VANEDSKHSTRRSLHENNQIKISQYVVQNDSSVDSHISMGSANRLLWGLFVVAMSLLSWRNNSRDYLRVIQVEGSLNITTNNEVKSTPCWPEPNLVRGGVFLLLYPDLKLLPEIAFPGREDIRKSSRLIISCVSCMGNQHGE
jgi:hypothetical protein